MMNIFVTNLSKRVTEDDLRWLFGEHGIVNGVSIWVDYEDRSLRFAIVQMRHSKDAKWAIKEIDGTRFRGRVLWVERAPGRFGGLRKLCSDASKNRNIHRPSGVSLLHPNGGYRLLQNALSRICGSCLISDVDAFTFDRFKDVRIAEGVSPAAVNRDLALARAAFNLAVERRMLPYSPLAGVKLFNEAKHRKPPRTISFPEEQRILMCCDVRLGLIVTVLLYTGMRVGIEDRY